MLFCYNHLIDFLFSLIQVVTTVVGTFCFPIDTVKRRLMIQRRILGPAQLSTVPNYPIDLTTNEGLHSKVNSINSNNSSSSSSHTRISHVPYRNGWDCARRIIQEEGVRGLFSGLSVNLVRGFSGAVLLVAYDEFKRIV